MPRPTAISFWVHLILAITLPIQLEAYFSWASLKDAANYAKDTVSYYAGCGTDAGNGTETAAKDSGKEKQVEPVPSADGDNPGKPADKPSAVKAEEKAIEDSKPKNSEEKDAVKTEKTKVQSKMDKEEDPKVTPTGNPTDKVVPKDIPDESESVEQRPTSVPKTTRALKANNDPGSKSKTEKDAEELPKPKIPPEAVSAPDVSRANAQGGSKKIEAIPEETSEPKTLAKESKDSKKTETSGNAKKTDSDRRTETSKLEKETAKPAKTRNAATFALYRLTGYITKPAKKIKELVVGKEKNPDKDSSGSTAETEKPSTDDDKNGKNKSTEKEKASDKDKSSEGSKETVKTDDSTTSVLWKKGASLLNAGKSAIFGTNDGMTGELSDRSVKERVKAKGIQANNQALADTKPEILAIVKRYMQDHNSFETAESKDGISNVSFKGLNITKKTDLTVMGDQFTFLFTGVTGDVTGKYEKKLLRFFKQAGDFTIPLKGASFCITGKAVPDAKPSPKESSEMTKEGPQYSLQKPDAGAQCVLTSYIEAKDIKRIDSGITGKVIKFVEKITKRFTKKVLKPIKIRVEDVLCEGVVAKLKEAFHSIERDKIEQIIN